MRNNYHNNPNQSEDSITKISRSKSRNQMTIANKIKEKVAPLSHSNAAGTIASTSNRSQSTTTTTSLTPNVTLPTHRSQKQTQITRQKVSPPSSRNDRNDLSKAKRVHEPSLDKSNCIVTQTKSAISPTTAKTNKGRSKQSTRPSQTSKNYGTRKPSPSATWKS